MTQVTIEWFLVKRITAEFVLKNIFVLEDR